MARAIKSHVMLDNVNAGLECTPEAKALRKVLENSGRLVSSVNDRKLLVSLGETELPGAKSPVQVCIKSSTAGKWYLNMQANPCSLRHSDNIYGTARATDKQIQRIFHQVLGWAESVGCDVNRLRAEVDQRRIRIGFLTFAAYGMRIPGGEGLLLRLMEIWNSIFRHGVWFDAPTGPEGHELTLCDALGIALASEAYESSINLDIFHHNLWAVKKSGKIRGAKLMHLCAYDKVREILSKDKNEKVPADIYGRLRFDATLTAAGLTDKVGSPFLGALSNHVANKHAGKWEGFARALFNTAIARTCLAYGLRTPDIFAPEHAGKLDLWDEKIDEREGRMLGRGDMWGPELREWAKPLGVNLEIPPEAHQQLLEAQEAIETNRRSLRGRDRSVKANTSYHRQAAAIFRKRTEEGRTGMAINDPETLEQFLQMLKLDFSEVDDNDD